MNPGLIDRGDVRRWLGALALAFGAACGPQGASPPSPALSRPLAAGLTWPAEQLLPSFPSPAPVQDLIMLHGREQHWEAEAPGLGHKTGRLETDGWLCQVGIDAPNEHMIYGPYDTTIPAGPNTAAFRLMTDDNTANDDPIVTLEVFDSTAGQTLATEVVTRKQFPVAAAYTTFSLPFTLGADNHALELRVLWLGAAYTKVDWVGVTRSQADDELVLFASLKGIVNATQPRIFSYEGDAFAEGPHAWLQSLGLTWTEIADNWALIAKYRQELGGIIVYDNAQPDTVNLATTLAGARRALVVAPSLAARLTAAPYGLPILLDLRGQFASKLAVYQTLHDTYWPTLTHRLAFGLNPSAVRASVREYATAVGAASLWLDPRVPSEAALLEQFLSSMGPGTSWMGWWPEEGSGVTAASKHGIATIASDYASNLTMHSGMPRTIDVPLIPDKPALRNKLYVAFILSDGDNIQYVEHLMRKLWSNPDRGKVPMGWTVSPAMVDAMPGALNYYWTTATANDCLVSGPSGYGYTYPNLWTNAAELDQFVETTERYVQRAGLRVITVWNTIVGGIDANVGESYASHAPSLLGLTAQNTGGGLTIYGNSLPGMALSCNYCTGEQAMKDFIASSSQGWDGNEPRFLIIQAQPWQDVTPTSFLHVASSLGSDYVVVRPDHIFELIREAKGLPVNPMPMPMPMMPVVDAAPDTSDAAAADARADVTDATADVIDGGADAVDAGGVDAGTVDAGREVAGGGDAAGQVDASVGPTKSPAGCGCNAGQESGWAPSSLTMLAVLGFVVVRTRGRNRTRAFTRLGVADYFRRNLRRGGTHLPRR